MSGFVEDFVDLRLWSPAALKRMFGSASQQQYTTLSPLTFISDRFGRLVVEAGFTSDLASIPRVAQAYVLNDDPDVALPSIIHDWGARHDGRFPGVEQLSRPQNDLLMRECMESVDARKDRILAVYGAIRFYSMFHGWEVTP